MKRKYNKYPKKNKKIFVPFCTRDQKKLFFEEPVSHAALSVGDGPTSKISAFNWSKSGIGLVLVVAQKRSQKGLRERSSRIYILSCLILPAKSPVEDPLAQRGSSGLGEPRRQRRSCPLWRGRRPNHLPSEP